MQNDSRTVVEVPEGRVLDGRSTTPQKLAHFVLNVRCYRECIEFYQRVIGARTVFGSEFITFLTYDDEHHRLALVNHQSGPERPDGCPGLEHIAFTFASLGDLLNNYVRLRELDITPYWTINHGPTISLYYRDPDRNQIELQCDCYPDPDELRDYFRNVASRINPLGVDFAIDDLVRRYESGEPFELLRVRSDAEGLS